MDELMIDETVPVGTLCLVGNGKLLRYCGFAGDPDPRPKITMDTELVFLPPSEEWEEDDPDGQVFPAGAVARVMTEDQLHGLRKLAHGLRRHQKEAEATEVDLVVDEVKEKKPKKPKREKPPKEPKDPKPKDPKPKKADKPPK
jgi:outer membrane biosynthesis protein TonB